MRGVTTGEFFGPSMPYGVIGYGEKPTPSRLNKANGENAFSDRSAYYWVGLIGLLVVWRVLIAAKGA